MAMYGKKQLKTNNSYINNLIIVLFIPVWWNWQTQGTFDLTNDKTGALLWKHSKWRWLKR